MHASVADRQRLLPASSGWHWLVQSKLILAGRRRRRRPCHDTTIVGLSLLRVVPVAASVSHLLRRLYLRLLLWSVLLDLHMLHRILLLRLLRTCLLRIEELLAIVGLLAVHWRLLLLLLLLLLRWVQEWHPTLRWPNRYHR
jgi:hypothetical protein